MSPTDGIFLFCIERDQRLSVSVCIFRKCSHLWEKDGEFFCKFVSEEKRVEEEEEEMKIILTYPDDLGEETEDEIIDWIKEFIKNKSQPLRYSEIMEVER